MRARVELEYEHSGSGYVRLFRDIRNDAGLKTRDVAAAQSMVGDVESYISSYEINSVVDEIATAEVIMSEILDLEGGKFDLVLVSVELGDERAVLASAEDFLAMSSVRSTTTADGSPFLQNKSGPTLARLLATCECRT